MILFLEIYTSFESSVHSVEHDMTMNEMKYFTAIYGYVRLYSFQIFVHYGIYIIKLILFLVAAFGSHRRTICVLIYMAFR